MSASKIRTIPFLAIVGLGSFIFLTWVTFVTPSLVDIIERQTGRGGSIDFVLRIYFLYACLLLLLVILYNVVAHPPNNRRIRLTLYVLAVHLIIAMLVWVFDPLEFTRESSAIRFFSTVSLLVAALFAGLNALAIRSGLPHQDRKQIFWILICLAFVSAAIDDYFNLHETIGHYTEPLALSAGMPIDLVQDSITLLYAVGAIIFVLLFKRTFQTDMTGGDRISGKLLIAGIFIYSVAVFFDFFDKKVDQLFFDLNPTFALNFFEELLEFTAGTIFACSFIVALMERHPDQIESMFGPESRGTPSHRAWGATLITLFLSATLVPLGARILGPPDSLRFSAAPGFSVRVFADHRDGLEGVDELSFHARLGLLAGVEATGKILAFDKGRDPRVLISGLKSPDGIAVGENRIYVADEVDREIRVFGFDGRSIARWTGWAAPEGVVLSASGSVLVADMGRGQIIEVSDGGREILASGLDGLRAPEQMALDALGNLYVTDESATAIFRIKPDGSVELFADKSDGIRIPEGIAVFGGNIYVADAGASKIFEFDQSGRGRTYIKFFRKKDLAGLAFDSSGVLYAAVTSDYRPYNQILEIRSDRLTKQPRMQ